MPDRFTTPTYDVTLEGADLTGCDIYITLRQRRTVVTVKDFEVIEIDPDAHTTRLVFTLTQMQTAKFRPDEEVEMQANVVDANGYRADSGIIAVTFGRNLLEVPKSHG